MSSAGYVSGEVGGGLSRTAGLQVAFAAGVALVPLKNHARTD